MWARGEISPTLFLSHTPTLTFFIDPSPTRASHPGQLRMDSFETNRKEQTG